MFRDETQSIKTANSLRGIPVEMLGRLIPPDAAGRRYVSSENLQAVLDSCGIDYSRWGTLALPKTKSIERLKDELAHKECVVRAVPVKELLNDEMADISLPESGYVLVRELVPVLAGDVYIEAAGRNYRMVEAGQVRCVKTGENRLTLVSKNRFHLRGAVAEKPEGVEAERILADTGELIRTVERAFREEFPAVKRIAKVGAPTLTNEPVSLSETYLGLPSRLSIYSVRVDLPADSEDVSKPILTYEEKNGEPDKITVFVFVEVSEPDSVQNRRMWEVLSKEKMADLVELTQGLAAYWMNDPRELDAVAGKQLSREWQFQ